jgi:DNA-directed RNA polymerase specialized sigma24 family protein
MEQVLSELSPIDRSVVYGRVVGECSYASLASIHGKSEAWVRKRYQLTREKMAKRLDELGYRQNNIVKSEVSQ